VIEDIERETGFGIGDAGGEETLPEELDVFLGRPSAGTEVDVVVENTRAVDDDHRTLLNIVFLHWVAWVGVQIHYIFPIITLMLWRGAGLSSMANIQPKPFIKQWGLGETFAIPCLNSMKREELVRSDDAAFAECRTSKAISASDHWVLYTTSCTSWIRHESLDSEHFVEILISEGHPIPQEIILWLSRDKQGTAHGHPLLTLVFLDALLGGVGS
jgi:hypothetical protein